jgi:hypothetical protein
VQHEYFFVDFAAKSVSAIQHFSNSAQKHFTAEAQRTQRKAEYSIVKVRDFRVAQV